MNSSEITTNEVIQQNLGLAILQLPTSITSNPKIMADLRKAAQHGRTSEELVDLAKASK